jgi:hypothetical protein
MSWSFACYIVFFLLGLAAVYSGQIHATYWGPTEGTNVRVGGMIAIFWSCWGLWSEWKKQKKQGSDSD